MQAEWFDYQSNELAVNHRCFPISMAYIDPTAPDPTWGVRWGTNTQIMALRPRKISGVRLRVLRPRFRKSSDNPEKHT